MQMFRESRFAKFPTVRSSETADRQRGVGNFGKSRGKCTKVWLAFGTHRNRMHNFHKIFVSVSMPTQESSYLLIFCSDRPIFYFSLDRIFGFDFQKIAVSLKMLTQASFYIHTNFLQRKTDISVLVQVEIQRQHFG